MIVTFTLKDGQKPTKEQLAEIAALKDRPIVFDEDCPELSSALQKAFRSAAGNRNRRIGSPNK